MNLLITGSSGQIGTNLALRALAVGHQVWGLDARPNRWSAAIPTIRHDLRVVRENFGNRLTENENAILTR